MKIKCGNREIETGCTGCPCHWMKEIQMGKRLDFGRCVECGCPKTLEAFELFWKAKKKRGKMEARVVPIEEFQKAIGITPKGKA